MKRARGQLRLLQCLSAMAVLLVSSSLRGDCAVQEYLGQLAGLDVTRAQHLGNPSSCYSLEDHRFVDFWQFEAQNGDPVSIELTTAEFTPILGFQDAFTAETLALKAGLSPGTIVISGAVPYTGTFYIQVGSLEEFGMGNYTIHLSQHAPPPTPTPASCARCGPTPTPPGCARCGPTPTPPCPRCAPSTPTPRVRPTTDFRTPDDHATPSDDGNRAASCGPEFLDTVRGL